MRSPYTILRSVIPTRLSFYATARKLLRFKNGHRELLEGRQTRRDEELDGAQSQTATTPRTAHRKSGTARS